MPGDGQRMDRRLQERINQTIRQRLALSDEQFDKMREVASRIEEDRRSLRSEEMTTRFAMRQELLAGEKANDKRVSELLDQMARIDRRRLDLPEREQRDLAKFLTATQRARYIGMQEQLRREMQDLQRRRLDRDSGDADRMRPGPRRLQRPPGKP
jgi:Spy/CpxP family protein refolding chaperone